MEGADVRLDNAPLFARVRTSSGVRPCARDGTHRRPVPVPTGTPLAIIVNGRVAAMTRSFVRDGRSRFVALVPEGVFRDGANGVDVYAVERRSVDTGLTAGST